MYGLSLGIQLDKTVTTWPCAHAFIWPQRSDGWACIKELSDACVSIIGLHRLWYYPVLMFLAGFTALLWDSPESCSLLRYRERNDPLLEANGYVINATSLELLEEE